MRVRVLAVIGLLLMLLIGFPRPAAAQEIAVVGVIVRVDAGQNVFWIQDYGSGGRTWLVRVTDFNAPGLQPGVRLRVGDVVEVRGWIAGPNQLIARSVFVQSGGGSIGVGPGLGPVGRDVEIDGVIVALDLYRQGIVQVQDRSRSRVGRVWTVRLTQRTRIEGDRGGRRRDDDDDDGQGMRAALRLLSVGDLVEVEGRLLGNGQVMAEEIKVRGQARYIPGYPQPGYPQPGYPQPVYPQPGYPQPGYPQPGFPVPPYYGQTVILRPQQGEPVSGIEFTVIGRTLPGAQVQIQVMGRWAAFQVQVASGTVGTDRNGTFTFIVRPSVRVPGAVYTITATSIYQGVSMAPVTVTVRQI